MSSPRIQKIYQGLTESLRKLGPYANAFKSGIKWQGRDADGKDAVLIDITDSAWLTQNLRVIIIADAASDSNNTAALKTQSHASGYFLDGSVSFRIYMETPSDHVGELAKFQREILHVLRGQLSAPIELILCDEAEEPEKNGINGAAADSLTFASAGIYQPYFFALSGGI